MRKITILLTKYSDWTSSLIYYLTGRGYTHASLGVENVYYSFNYKGFHTETVESHRRHGVKRSISCELLISEESYQRLWQRIQRFERNRTQFHYSRLGVVFCLLRIPFHREKHYFCSQFVAEMLKQSGAVSLEKKPELYLPNHFLQELRGNSQVVRVQVNPI